MSKNNQPAFPVALEGAFINSENNLKPFAGMSLRDYFAAAALQADTSDGEWPSNNDRAEWCYAMADAMLKARNQ